MTYTLLDFSSGQRLEQWGEFRLIRPDPTAVANPSHPELWETANATYEGEKGKGEWRKTKDMPSEWTVEFDDLELLCKLAPYKHTGVFPEQDQNWRWMREVGEGDMLNVLNLFAYTGGATMALAKDGHFVTHVDSSKPAIAWAKENALLNDLPANAVRWIVEDAALFVSREKKRGKTYDGIILDPPAFGHSPSGKAWRVERDLAPLLEDCVSILSEHPSFIVLNGYAQHDSPESFHRLLKGILHSKRPDLEFKIEAEPLMLKTEDGRELETGIVAKCGF